MPFSADDDDARPFNPFYIGPHPSKACALPEAEPQQCSPCGQTNEDAVANEDKAIERPGGSVLAETSGPADAATSGQAVNPANNAGLLIVGITGPTGGMATIYSTAQTPAAAATAATPAGAAGANTPTATNPGFQQETAAAPCRTYPCMEATRNDDPGSS